jgi:FkbM family methyltransferase
LLRNVGVRIWLMWFDNIFSHLRRKSRSPRKFAILSPPFLAEQKIKHIKSNSIFTINVRNSVDLRTLYDIFYKEEYSAWQFIDRLKAVDSDHLIIDLGANIGCASLYFLYIFRRSHLIALEPDYENFAILSDNLRNYTTRATLLNAGAGPKDAFCKNVNSAEGSDQFDAFRFEESDSGKIKMRSLKGLLSEYSSNHQRVILKVDIEGYERYIFEGETSWFDNVDIVFIEGHDWMIPRASTLSDFLSLVSNKNFDVFVRGENIIAVRHNFYE